MPIRHSTPLAVLLLSLLPACSEPAEELPGSYTGTLDTAVTASRMADRRPNGDGFVATITHYTNGASATGVQLPVRRMPDVGGNPSFEASLGDVCDIHFQLLDGGTISDNMLPNTCRCSLDGGWVSGEAAITGDFTERELRIQVNVTLPRSEYTGGCTYTFRATRP